MNLDQIVEKTTQAIKLRGYSRRTVQAYTHCIKRYFSRYGGDTKWVEVEKIKAMLLDLRAKDFAPKTIDLHLNAVKFFYREVMGNAYPIKIKCSKRARRLPVVLSKPEIERVLEMILNRKHRLMVALAYSAGLRVSEVVSLRVCDVDVAQGILTVRQAKGQKDRITVFSAKLRADLERQLFGRSGDEWLFESEWGGELSTRTLQAVFSAALKRAGVLKPATFHSLRHSFATHVLEAGTDVLHLQKVLGHKDLRTTQIYTHVANSNIARIQSPL